MLKPGGPVTIYCILQKEISSFLCYLVSSIFLPLNRNNKSSQMQLIVTL
jgi:hypothetical protein